MKEEGNTDGKKSEREPEGEMEDEQPEEDWDGFRDR